ncbi:MAG: iron uptake porin [Leptolyngbya sp. BL-A-14]
MSQVSSVSQLSDVQPTDWAFQALQSLVERYGCIAGYPDKTYRGNRSLTRYEFAAGLNACLDRINELIATGTANLTTKADLATVQKLQEEFAAELATLRGRVDALEARTARLETTQFSTTTKLAGEVIFGLTGTFGNEKAASIRSNQSNPLNEAVIVSDRIRLRLNTSFTGQDLLRIRLQAANTPNLVGDTGTNMARLGFDSPIGGNQVVINQLYYRFPISPSAKVTVLASGALFDVVDTLNPLLGVDSTGSPFLFGIRSPIYREEIGGAGAGISYDFSSNFNLGLVYLSPTASQPASGLFNGSYSALAQLTWRPNDNVALGLLYSRSRNGIEINAGSANANNPFGNASDNVTANSYGLVGNVRISPNFAIGGWTGFVQATAQDLPGDPDANIFYYAVTLAFPDVGKKGNIGGIIFGQPPKVVRNEFGIKDPNSSFNIEAFYRFQINDYIGITPGLLVIINPEHNSSNDTLYIGTIRTTFTF